MELPFQINRAIGCVLVAIFSQAAAAPHTPNERVSEYCLGEAAVDQTGRLIHTKEITPQNPHAPMMPASTVKLLTAALSLKHLPDLNQPITYFHTRDHAQKKGTELCRPATETDDPKRFVKISTTVEQAIIAMLMISDNDAAIKLQSLLEDVTKKPYATLASIYLKGIKLDNSHFYEGAGISNISVCNGMIKVDHRESAEKLIDQINNLPKNVNISTPLDMARLAQNITSIPKIQEFLKVATLKLSGLTLHKRSKPWNSDPNSFFKTGFTNPAGTALVGTFGSSSQNRIGLALMHCKPKFPGDTTPNQRDERFVKLKNFFNKILHRSETVGLDNNTPPGNSGNVTIATVTAPKF